MYGTLDMPRFGDASSTIHQHVAPEYIQQNVGKLDTASTGNDFGPHVPNMVTGVLVAYRGFDTLFETAVIFSAGIGLILLLRPTQAVKRRAEAAS